MKRLIEQLKSEAVTMEAHLEAYSHNEVLLFKAKRIVSLINELEKKAKP